MRRVNVSQTRENLAELLAAVEGGEEIVIVRRDRPVAKLVAVDKPMTAFLDRSELRGEVPPMQLPAAQIVRGLRNDERY